MRILYLVHRVPYPPDKGDKIRSWNWLRQLARHHEVHLVALWDDPADLEHRDVLERHCASVHLARAGGLPARLGALRALVGGGPLSLPWFGSRELQRAVDRLVEEDAVDVALGFSAPMAAYLLGRHRLPFVMDMVDVDSAKFADYSRRFSGPRSFVYGLEARRLARYEERLAAELNAVVLCTEPEAELLRRRCRGGRIVPIPNGALLPDLCEIPERRDRPLIVFVGAMDYPPNVDAVDFAAREILPRVRAVVPEAVFRIVGKNPTSEVEALASLPGVEVTGAVADIADHLKEAAVSLVSLRIAQGIQNKVLEAMAWRLPVVTTTRVGRSLGAEGADVLILADTAEDSSRAVIDLLSDAALRRRLGDAGRDFVARHFSWDESAGALEVLLAEAAGLEPAVA